MKYVFLTIILSGFSSCKVVKNSHDVEGFTLGAKITSKKIKSKLGDDNTITKIYKSVRDSNKVGFLFDSDTWDYVFPNGKKGFITFYTDSINNLVKVWMQMGALKEEFPYLNSTSSLWKIREYGDKSDIEYMRTYLTKKYGQPSDSLSSGLFRESLWKLPDFNVELNFYQSDSSKLNILYYLTPTYKHLATPPSLENKEEGFRE